jgi:fused signal recognition particle receptor
VPAWLGKLRDGLARTRAGLAASLSSVVRRGAVDEAVLEDLETALLAADLGPDLAAEVLASVRSRATAGGETLDAVRRILREALPAAPVAPPRTRPHVVFVVGVNGGGKTTTVGKLAAREKAAGRRVMMVAADTFRAAAIDQLERWSERAGVELIKHRERADAAAVVFDALQSAKTRGVDAVYVDTAGRLHTKANLMAELGKLGRVAGREVEGAPHEVLLVIDATTGQNGLAQAEEFARALGLSGVVLTKLDGTAKGGVALSIHRRLGVPIRCVGVGEGLDDLIDFDPDAFVEGLLGGGAS